MDIPAKYAAWIDRRPELEKMPARLDTCGRFVLVDGTLGAWARGARCCLAKAATNLRRRPRGDRTNSSDSSTHHRRDGGAGDGRTGHDSTRNQNQRAQLG